LKLYVKSESTGAIERSPGLLFHTCDLRGKENITFYPEEDKEAIEFLEGRSFSFEIVDLSRCPLKTRLKAMITGINTTPTLIIEDGTKLKGIKQIKDYFATETSRV
jgi:hypothetical protein